MTGVEHERLRESLGAYVLGQLDGPGSRAVVAHLEGCPQCRTEVEQLRPVAAAVQALDPTLSPTGQGDDPLPPAELEAEVVHGIAARRRETVRRGRRRRALAGGLAAGCAVIAFAAGSWYAGPRNDPPVVSVAVRLDQPGVQADAGLVRHTWGTELKLQATGLVDGGSYEVTFVGKDGSRVDAGSFLGTGARAVRCSVNAALPLDGAASFAVTDARGALVLDGTV